MADGVESGDDETPETETREQSQETVRETMRSASERSDEFYETTYETTYETENRLEPESNTFNGVEDEDKDADGEQIEGAITKKMSLQPDEIDVTSLREEQPQKAGFTTRRRDHRLSQRRFLKMIGKHELRNEELGKREGDLRQRLGMLECSMPAVMVWNIWRMAQGNSVGSLRRIVQKQFREGEAYCPITPSRHYDCRVREVEAERKYAQKRAEEARALWSEKATALEERKKRLEEARRIQEERKTRIEQLRKEAQELREALSGTENGGSCVAGECGDVQCRDRWLGKASSTSSIRSADVECLERLQELAENEICVKRQIADLERREDAYMRILQQADELWGKMEGDSASTVSALQNLLDAKTATSQQLAERVCELEDQLEKLRSKMARCRAELEKYMSIGKIEAAIGRDSDLVGISDKSVIARAMLAHIGAGGDDDLAGTFDETTLAQVEGMEKYVAAQPDLSEFGIDRQTDLYDVEHAGIAATPEDIAYEAEKQQELESYFAMLDSIDDLYTEDDTPCAPEFACNDVVLSPTGMEPEELMKLESLAGGMRDLALTDMKTLIQEGESEGEVCAPDFVCNDVVKSPTGMEAEETAELEAVTKTHDVSSHLSSKQTLVESLPEKFSGRLEEDVIAGKESQEVRAEEDGVAVARNELLLWFDTCSLIRDTVANCSNCSVLVMDADKLAKRIALYAGVKYEISEGKPILSYPGIPLKEEHPSSAETIHIKKKLEDVPDAEELQVSSEKLILPDGIVTEIDAVTKESISEVEKQFESDETAIIETERSLQPAEIAIIESTPKVSDLDQSSVTEIEVRTIQSEPSTTKVVDKEIYEKPVADDKIVLPEASRKDFDLSITMEESLDGMERPELLETEYPLEPPTTPVLDRDDIKSDEVPTAEEVARMVEAEIKIPERELKEEAAETPKEFVERERSLMSVEVEDGKALPIMIIQEDEMMAKLTEEGEKVSEEFVARKEPLVPVEDIDKKTLPITITQEDEIVEKLMEEGAKVSEEFVAREESLMPVELKDEKALPITIIQEDEMAEKLTEDGANVSEEFVAQEVSLMPVEVEDGKALPITIIKEDEMVEKLAEEGAKASEEFVAREESPMSVEVEGGKALPITFIQEDEMPREMAELIDEVREIEPETVITVEDTEREEEKFGLEEGVDERKETILLDDIEIEEKADIPVEIYEPSLREIETEIIVDAVPFAEEEKEKEIKEEEKVVLTEEEESAEVDEKEEFVALRVTRIEEKELPLEKEVEEELTVEEGMLEISEEKELEIKAKVARAEEEEKEKPMDLEVGILPVKAEALRKEKESLEAIFSPLEEIPAEEPEGEIPIEVEEEKPPTAVEEIEEKREEEETEEDRKVVSPVVRVKERTTTPIDPRLVAKPYLAVAEIEDKIRRAPKSLPEKKGPCLCEHCLLKKGTSTVPSKQPSAATTATIRTEAIETEIIQIAIETEEITNETDVLQAEYIKVDSQQLDVITSEISMTEVSRITQRSRVESARTKLSDPKFRPSTYSQTTTSSYELPESVTSFRTEVTQRDAVKVEVTKSKSIRSGISRAEAIQTEIPPVEGVETDIFQTEAVQTITSAIISAGTQTWSLRTIDKPLETSSKLRDVTASGEKSSEISAQKRPRRKLPSDRSTVMTSTAASQTYKIPTREDSRKTAFCRDDVSSSARGTNASSSTYSRGGTRDASRGVLQAGKYVDTEQEIRSISYARRTGDRKSPECDCCACGKTPLPVPTNLLRRFVAAHFPPKIPSKVSSGASSKVSMKILSEATPETSAQGLRRTSMPTTSMFSDDLLVERLCSECKLLRRKLLERQRSKSPRDNLQNGVTRMPVLDREIQSHVSSGNVGKLKAGQKKKEAQKKDQSCLAKIPKLKGNSVERKKKIDMSVISMKMLEKNVIMQKDVSKDVAKDVRKDLQENVRKDVQKNVQKDAQRDAQKDREQTSLSNIARISPLSNVTDSSECLCTKTGDNSNGAKNKSFCGCGDSD